MKKIQIIFFLIVILVSANAYCQSENDSASAKEINPAKNDQTTDSGIKWKRISKKDLLAVKQIEELTSDATDVKYKIVSCKVIFDGEDVPYFEYELKGNEFSEAIMGNIEKSTPGTKIIIESIKVSEPDGTLRAQEPVNLIVAD